ncbi:MAG: tRNA (adenosine(37)-N6)-threonylcarbamoyltransferase complex dimerization subunit type 1 TsaB [Kiritimatiellae bacterium]|nr:tRNA (adenosine(37)-N6)-threonylcarbamoyltransferase complex dimerization subunit type 1 TsaB [Kiritimatiellia bacterium]
MRRLILDRSCSCAGFAFTQEDRVLCKKLWEGKAARSPAWLAEMADVMRAFDCRLDQVDEFVCAIGPGSFSGIRAALAACSGMALPGRNPLLGISSAAALAFEYALGDYAAVTVIGDARRSRLWCVSYQLSLDAREFKLFAGAPISNTAGDFELLTAEELERRIPAGTLIISPDWDRVGDLLMERFPAERLVKKQVSPDLDVLARLAHCLPTLCRPEPLPIYLHPAAVVKA